jgi:hypothetical protein
MTVSPPQRMDHTIFLDLFGGTRGDDGIADIGVHLGEEVAGR